MRGKCVLPLLIFVLYNATAFAQERHYELIKEETCGCVTKLTKEKAIGYMDIKECLKSAMQNNLQLMYQEVLTKRINKGEADSVLYRKGQEYGRILGSRLDTALVFSCDVYYHVTDTLRYQAFAVYKKDSILTVLKDFNARHPQLDVNAVEMRAKLNFLAGNYLDALTDANAVLEKKNSSVALTVKGYSLEGMKRFAEAADVYRQIASLSGQNNYLVWAAIATRKAAEKK